MRQLSAELSSPRLLTNEKNCRLWQFKLQICCCQLFLILVRNFASFIQMLKILSNFVKNSCFYPVKHEKSIKFFRVQVWQKYQVFRVHSDKNVDKLFFRVRQNRLFSSLSSNLQPGSKYWYGFVVFNREFTKLATGVSFFVLVASKDGSTIRYVQNLHTAVRTSHLEPYCTSVPYFSSIFEEYRTRIITKRRTVPAYRTSYQKLRRTIPYLRTVPYCHSCF